MSRQNSIIARTRCFHLSRRQQKNGRVFYVVSAGFYAFGINTMNEIRDLFDPLRNKSGHDGTSWKYSNRKDAEQMYIMATLRWS